MNLFDLSLRIQGYNLPAARGQFRNLSKELKENREEYLNRKKSEILQFHKQHNPFFKEFCSARNEWSELPIITKRDLQQPIENLLTSGYRKRDVFISNTSGSSGHPFFFAKDKFCHALAWANIEFQYSFVNLHLRSRQARFYGIPLSRKGFWKEKSKDFIANRVRFPVFDLQDSVLERWLTVFRREKFEQINGYTSSIVRFARYCLKNKIILKDLCPSLEVCIVTSEVCTIEERTIIQKGFGVPVVNEYGASELGIIGFDISGGGWAICEELIYLEVVDDKGHPVPDGVEGRIICTSLFNKAFPLIRYQIGDVGVVTRVNGRITLQKLLGRTNDMAILPSGKVSPGLTFYYISKSILESKGLINEFIIRQTGPATFRFIIHAESALSQADEDVIKEKMDLYLEPGLNLELEYVDQIQRQDSGKIKHFYCDI